jgi:hypothetical protein
MRVAYRSIPAWLVTQLAVFGTAWAIIIVADPFVTFVTPLALQAANTAPLATLAVVLSIATGRPLFVVFVMGMAVGLLVYIDLVKAAVVHAHVIYADMRVVPMLITQPRLVGGFVARSPWLLGFACAAGAVLLWFGWRCAKVTCPAWLRVAAAGAGIALLAAAELPDGRLVPTHPEWVVFQQPDEATRYGIFGNLLFGWRLSSAIILPGDGQSRHRLLTDPGVATARRQLSEPTSTTPDIVVVQSESLFDPSALCGTADAPALPAVAASRHGPLHVPVFGGRTLQTEFETLSGVPVSKFPNADFAYLDLVRGNLDAFPAQLDRLGYRTIAIHPNDRNFWRRNYALPALGFQTFIDVNAFSDVDVDHSGHVTDAALTDATLAELDADTGPSFVFVVTIENHGPWGGGGKSELTDYTARAQRADAAWQRLIDGLAARRRPAIAVIYGDHLPGLADTFASMCFKDGRKPEEHMPPVAFWTNIPGVDPRPPVASYLISGWLLDAARLPRSPLYELNAAIGKMGIEGGYAAAERVETDYAGVTGQWLAAQPAGSPPRTALLPDGIARELKGMQIVGERGPWSPQDLLLSQPTGPGSFLRIPLDGRIASMTFRPYPGDPACKATDPIGIQLDGRDAGVIGGEAKTVLATVRTAGATELRLVRQPTGDGTTCATTVVRVVQMEKELSNALATAPR